MRFLKKREVLEMLGVSMGTLYELMRNHGFPTGRRISPNRTGWLDVEVLAWMDARPEIERGQGHYQETSPNNLRSPS